MEGHHHRIYVDTTKGQPISQAMVGSELTVVGGARLPLEDKIRAIGAYCYEIWLDDNESK